MMSKRSFYKLLTKPRLFFTDYKKNKRVFKNLLKEDKTVLKNNFNLTNPILNFNMEYVLQELNSFNPKGLYIKPLNEKLKWTIAVNNRDKTDFIFKFLNFININNIDIQYKYNNKVKKFTSISQFGLDIHKLKNLDIRLSTMRTFPLSRLWFRLEFWDEFEDFYVSPVSNHISRKLWKNVAKEHNIFYEDKIIDYSCILEKSHELENTLDVDLVFTWVNSEDEEWKEMYSKYKPSTNDETDATSTSRFLSRDELKYALRSWDKYGSFIKKIYIVSNCKPPEWLDLNQANLKWIYHEEIMPENVLPTFSSHAIETSLHKIKGLSNYFIYSNDDVLLVRPSNSNDFFYPNGIVKLKLEPYGNINGSIKIGDPDYLNAARNVNKLLEIDFNKSTTHLHTHSSQAMRIDILREMEAKYTNSFRKTLSNRFRMLTDISVASYMYPHYTYLSGKGIPTDIKVELIQQKHNFKKKLKNILIWHSKNDFKNLPLSVCLNDGGDSHLNEDWNDAIINFLKTIFPENSKYEK